MHYFKALMSYTDIVLTLSDVKSQKRALTRLDLQYLNKSLSDPLLQATIALYPLPKELVELVQEAVARERARMPDVVLPLHSSFYGGVREKAAAFLEKTFPPNNNIKMIARLAEFVLAALDTQRAEQLLLEAEERRYQERQKKEILTTQYSLDAIKEDFISYLAYLGVSKDERSSDIFKGLYDHVERFKDHSWKTLNSLFQYIGSFEPNSPERFDADLGLLAALDRSRTAYHALEKKYIAGKDYASPQGFHEALLDAYSWPVATPDAASLLIEKLTSPFITYTERMKAEGESPRPSELLCHIYVDAAGYSKKAVEITKYRLLGDPTLSSLAESYLAKVSDKVITPGMEEEALRDLHYTLKILRDGKLSCTETELFFSGVINFLKEHSLIEVQNVLREEMIPPKQPKQADTIINEMFESGKFLDIAHLQMVLTIIGDSSLSKMASYTTNHPFLVKENNAEDITPLLSRYDLQLLYRNYLSSSKQAFCAFYEPDAIAARVAAADKTLSMSDEALSQWLESYSRSLTLPQASHIAKLCSIYGYSSSCRTLLRSVPLDVNVIFKDPLVHFAALNGHVSILEILIEANANINLLNQDGEIALITAASNGHAECLRALLATKESKDGIDLVSGGVNALLTHAATFGHVGCVKALVEYGANIDFQDHDNHLTALMRAAYHQHWDCVEYLIGAGANINLKSKQNTHALIWVVTRNDINSLNSLIEAGADIHVTDDKGFNALMYASALGRKDCVRILLRAGADLEQQSFKEGYSALILAAHNGFSEIITLLVNAGANLHAQNISGCNALTSAVLRSHLEAVQTLINLGAVDMPDSHNNTALTYTIEMQWLCGIQALRAAKNGCDKEGASMLAALLEQRRYAENVFMRAATIPKDSKDCHGIELTGLNVNRFLSTGDNALTIALRHNNISLARDVLAQEELAPWVVLEALHQNFDGVLPLVVEHQRFIKLLELRINDFSPIQQQNISELIAQEHMSSYRACGIIFSKAGTTPQPVVPCLHKP